MAEPLSSFDPSSGKITRNLEEGTLINRTLRFVQDELPNWRDDPNREKEFSEPSLNAQLCKYLNSVSREKLRMVIFHHEEKQTGRHSVDFSALPSESGFVGTTFYSVYDPFLVFEGKRLPAPKGNPSREREYLTGGNQRSGGVQRFKLGLHGSEHRIAGLVGYIQKEKTDGWFIRINEWIVELSATETSPEKWYESEKLANFVGESVTRTARCSSNHPRASGVSDSISICHLWVEIED